MYAVTWLLILFVIAVACILTGLWFQRHRRCRSCAHWTKTKHPYCPHCGRLRDVDFYSEPDLPATSLRLPTTTYAKKPATRTINIPQSFPTTRLITTRPSSRSGRRPQPRVFIDDPLDDMLPIVRDRKTRLPNRTIMRDGTTRLPLRTSFVEPPL